MPVILRSEKGSALTHNEMDGNFTVARNSENSIAALQSDVAALQTDIAALQATVPIGELVVTAAMMTARGNVTANPSGHPVVQLPNSGVNEISATLVHIPPQLRNVNLTVTAYFNVEDLGGQVRLTWDLHDVGSGPSSTSFTTTIRPNSDTLNPQVLTTTLQLTGAGPASMADVLIRRDSGDAADTYGGTLDFYMLRIEATNPPLKFEDSVASREVRILPSPALNIKDRDSTAASSTATHPTERKHAITTRERVEAIQATIDNLRSKTRKAR